MHKGKRLWFIASIFLLSLGFAACGPGGSNSSGGSSVVPVTGVYLNTSTLGVVKGTSAALTARVMPVNATNRNVTWISSDPSVADVDAVGNVSVDASATAGNTATITVTTEDGGFTDTCTITVQDAPVAVTGVTLSPDTLDVQAGGAYVLTVAITPPDATNKNVIWSSNNESVAVVDNGVVTVQVGANNGDTAIITVTTKDGNFTDTCTVQVRTPSGNINVINVTLRQQDISIEVGEEYYLFENVEPYTAANKNVTWESQNPSIATVDPSGKVTGAAEGTTTVTVTTEDGGFKAVCTVHVTGERELLSGGEVITDASKLYKLAAAATGKITIQTAERVDIKGQGVGVKIESLVFDCKGQSTDLLLRDLFISNTDKSKIANVIDFASTGNKLTFEGICMIDYDVNFTAPGAGGTVIHVPPAASLTILGGGTYYQYNRTQGAGIGGDSGEMNGDITFSMTGSAFIKGTKQGAVIGAGANANGSGIPGSITFTQGEYNLISNSRGATIGGSAGSGGASEGTTVYIKGGCININTDWSGASVGGGGFDSGNDSSGGTVYISGGSLRIYVDKNAANNLPGNYWKGLPLVEGINNVSMTAERKNSGTLPNEDVYLCIIDTETIPPAADGSYTVKVDGTQYYKGGLHSYFYVQENKDKATGEQLPIIDTRSNWGRNVDTNLYIYLTGQDHAIDVNGVSLTATYNASAVVTPAIIDECNGGVFTVTKN